MSQKTSIPADSDVQVGFLEKSLGGSVRLHLQTTVLTLVARQCIRCSYTENG